MVKAQEIVDVGGGHLTGGHSADDGGRPGNRVSAGKDIIRPGHRAGEVDLDGPAAGGDAHCLKGLGCNGLTDGHDYIVAGNAELLLLGLGGRGATIPTIEADDLRLGPQGGHLALLIGLNADWRLQGQDLAPLGHSLLDFLCQGGHVLYSAAIDTGDALSAQPQGGTGSVHRDVAATDDANLLTGEVGDVSIPDTAE